MAKGDGHVATPKDKSKKAKAIKSRVAIDSALGNAERLLGVLTFAFLLFPFALVLWPSAISSNDKF
jgi:hypothetical protein